VWPFGVIGFPRPSLALAVRLRPRPSDPVGVISPRSPRTSTGSQVSGRPTPLPSHLSGGASALRSRCSRLAGGPSTPAARRSRVRAGPPRSRGSRHSPGEVPATPSARPPTHRPDRAARGRPRLTTRVPGSGSRRSRGRGTSGCGRLSSQPRGPPVTPEPISGRSTIGSPGAAGRRRQLWLWPTVSW